ncbi:MULTISPECIES: hypothetical protein [Bizionia]|uniref:SGNH/GDSL hydrolase family protein n=1 Tax=Bizionia algoritergicola TaxID=291187 RepID=A0A5D0QTX3_9FLAO|nr:MULTISPECIES: hypothetical protein [Bizionia]OBX23265.1 hypothetical protein BAA08_05580 [Bizionia sp. APA-3]TYB71634.1 hypothetical protein ES675_13865 [Bizionia algoritergicola]
MRLFFKRIGFILLLFIGVSSAISYGSLWALRQGSFYKPSFLEQQIQTSEFDYIILGSSTGLTTLNTQVIDSVSGRHGLNLSMDDTSLSSQYLMLQHFIASGKQTPICVLAASILDYDVIDHVLSGNDYRFLPYVSRGYVYDYYGSFPGSPARISANSNWFPMLGVGYYNAELFYPSLVSLVQPQKRNRFDAYGNYSYPITTQVSALIVSRRSKTLQFKNPYFKKIQDLCAKNDMALVVYIPPHKTLAVETGPTSFPVINHSDVLNDTRYFYDDFHVNRLGRQTVSLLFAGMFSIHSDISP